MKRELTEQLLLQENECYSGTGGVSKCNRGYGFIPAFRDNTTGEVYLSRFSNGMTAPVHMLDGLPDEVVVARTATGRVRVVKGSLVSGFLQSGRFFTREEAAEAAATRH